jgi:predicted ArsR family transcriptional regulator
VKPPSHTGKRIIKVNAITQAQLIKLLLEGTYTCVELAEMTGLHYVTVLQYTRELHRAGAAHICAWEKDARGRDILKIYKLGAGKDAKRQRMTEAQKQARYRAKMQAARLLHAMAGQSSSAAISSGLGL